MGGNGIFSSKCDFIRPLFGIEKVDKRFSPLKRRSESAATWGISPTATIFRLRNLKNPRFVLSTKLCREIARRCSALLDDGFCTKLNYFGESVIFYILKQSTGHTFPTSSPTAR